MKRDVGRGGPVRSVVPMLGLLLLIGLVGCGSEEPSTAPSEPASTSAPATSAAVADPEQEVLADYSSAWDVYVDLTGLEP